MANKVSKKDVLQALATFNFTEDIQVGDVTVTPDDIQDFISLSINQIETRAIKAKEKAAEKRAAGDELRAQIKNSLGSTPMTITEIIKALDNVDITPAMVVARLTQLTKAGEVFKADKRVDGRAIKVYAVEPITDEVDG